MESEPVCRDVINQLRSIADVLDCFDEELQAMELSSAIKCLQRSGLPRPGSDECANLEGLLYGSAKTLTDHGCFFLAKELRELRLTSDQ